MLKAQKDFLAPPLEIPWIPSMFRKGEEQQCFSSVPASSILERLVTASSLTPPLSPNSSALVDLLF